MRTLIGYCGISIAVVCVSILILAMVGTLPALNDQFFHQSGIRWLAEGAIAGTLCAAFGFWDSGRT